MSNLISEDYYHAGTNVLRVLGKSSPKEDSRTLKLSRYLSSVPAPPKVFDPDAGRKIVPSWEMYLNDSIGDCTFAAAAHMIEWWTALSKKLEVHPTTLNVLKAYEAVSGYDPKTGNNDNGAAELDVLNYWRNTGIGGHKIVAYAAVNPKNLIAVKQACWLFGSVYLGLSLPLAAQNMTDRFDIPKGQKLIGDWEPDSWGGHAVPVISYDNGVLAMITWGARVKMTWDFFAAYCDEAYAVMSMDWIAGKAAPNGFDVATLQNDLSKIAA